MVHLASDDVGEIRSRIPLEDLVRDYNVQLLPSGGKRFRALCPFHREKTPSFYVDAEKQFFHCFGCKEGGDIFSFVEKMDHVGFGEALEILARKAGVELRRRGERSEGRGEKLALFDILAAAEEFYHRILIDDPRGAPARAYLQSREIRPEMWKRFRLGYSLPEWEGLFRHLIQKRVAPEMIENAGLARARASGGAGGNSGADAAGVARGGGTSGVVGAGGGGGYYDYFRGRVMFPISDGQKRVIGFGARTLGDDQPKYLNTPRTPLFDKGQVLYALPLARAAIHATGRIAIMEGYTDVIMAHQEGLENAVASLGTAFTAENGRKLRGLAQRVDLVFDGDAAGQSATERSLELLVAEDLDVRVFTVTTGKDPCDALRELGGEEFRRRLDEQAVDIFEFKWKRTVAAADARGEGPAGVARALDEVLDLLVKVPNIVARKLQVQRLAERLGLNAADVDRRLAARAGKSAMSSAMHGGALPGGPVMPGGSGPQHGGRVFAGAAGGSPSGGDPISTAPTVEEVVLECLLAEPDRARERAGELSVGDGVDGAWAELFPVGGLRGLAAALERELAAGPLDTSGLLASVRDGEERKVLLGILARLQWEASGQKIPREDVWKTCLRELARKTLEQRGRELEEAKARARHERDEAGYLALQREHLDVLRRLKSPYNRKDGDRTRPDAASIERSSRKGPLGNQEARG